METPPFLQRFEDNHSSLMDRFERLSFEAHLSNALLGRSLSESGFSLMYSADFDDSPIRTTAPVCQGRRGSGLNKILKNLMKPVRYCSRKIGRGRKQEAHDFDPKSLKKWQTFSRSVRLFWSFYKFLYFLMTWYNVYILTTTVIVSFLKKWNKISPQILVTKKKTIRPTKMIFVA